MTLLVPRNANTAASRIWPAFGFSDSSLAGDICKIAANLQKGEFVFAPTVNSVWEQTLPAGFSPLIRGEMVAEIAFNTIYLQAGFQLQDPLISCLLIALKHTPEVFEAALNVCTAFLAPETFFVERGDCGCVWTFDEAGWSQKCGLVLCLAERVDWLDPEQSCLSIQELMLSCLPGDVCQEEFNVARAAIERLSLAFLTNQSMTIAAFDIFNQKNVKTLPRFFLIALLELTLKEVKLGAKADFTLWAVAATILDIKVPSCQSLEFVKSKKAQLKKIVVTQVGGQQRSLDLISHLIRVSARPERIAHRLIAIAGEVSAAHPTSAIVTAKACWLSSIVLHCFNANVKDPSSSVFSLHNSYFSKRVDNDVPKNHAERFKSGQYRSANLEQYMKRKKDLSARKGLKSPLRNLTEGAS